MIRTYIALVIASLPLFFDTFEKEVSKVEVEEKKNTEYVEDVIEESPIIMKASFYTAYCEGCIGITKSGHDVRNTIYYEGMRILAAPKHIPLYTIYDVTLEDGETFRAIVLDRGGAIKGDRLDILVSTKEYAFQKGRQIAYMKEVKQ